MSLPRLGQAGWGTIPSGILLPNPLVRPCSLKDFHQFLDYARKIVLVEDPIRGSPRWNNDMKGAGTGPLELRWLGAAPLKSTNVGPSVYRPGGPRFEKEVADPPDLRLWFFPECGSRNPSSPGYEPRSRRRGLGGDFHAREGA